ncbi:hypothetical protein T12_9227 [Trichinella patagoniensis]|uniref:Uncharacterized protein n=1 Tax=Trichinella patagoniensis TaxID=990121 RepID=A0A0V0YUL1_9BILA|nr:hypothetical protein T12_9227 [Trichinella patagoniensis]
MAKSFLKKYISALPSRGVNKIKQRNNIKIEEHAECLHFTLYPTCAHFITVHKPA